jgi:hypothetical protein
MKKLKIALASIVCFAIGFIITDCSAGKSASYSATISAHQYKPAWTEFITSIDSDGNITLIPVCHSEEYHLYCRALEYDKTFDIHTSRSTYISVTNNQSVMIRTRVGKWTRIDYLASVDP